MHTPQVYLLTDLLLYSFTNVIIFYFLEVLEFGEPGGMMDQYSTAVGDVILLSSQPINVVKYSMKSRMNGVFILADSLEPKETLRILARVKYTTMDGIKKIKSVGKISLSHSITYSFIHL